MLRIEKGKQTSFYSTLYDKIPEKHLLKRIDKSVDFSFINKLLEDRYCKNFGRPAKEPEMMAKLLFLQYIYDLSDVKAIEESSFNLAYLYFLGLNPEDPLPDPSLLAKFRTQRLDNVTLDAIIMEIVRQCIEKGIIKSDGVSVDTTHIEANCTKKVPERVMKHLAKKIFKAVETDNGEIPQEINTDIPDYTQIEDHKEAKETMKSFVEETIAAAEPYAGEETNKAIEEAKEVLSDEKFMQQKGVRSLSDKDARVGNKSKTDQFFGYKAEYMMTTDERIITAVDVHSGDYVDGKDFNNLLEKTKESGVEVKELYGDKAYFRKDILDELEEQKIKGYIPVSASVYKIDEDLFSYNKDSDEWFCRRGNHTVKCDKRTEIKRGEKYGRLVYTFDKEMCKDCPHRAECIGKARTKAKRLMVSTSTAFFYEKSQEQKTPEFLEKYKKRSSQEWKNGEMKRFHGLSRARGRGLRSMLFQAKLTATTVNLKRIAALFADFLHDFQEIIQFLKSVFAFPQASAA